MGVIAWIIIGLLAGWLATQILGGRGGLLYNLAVGLVGAIARMTLRGPTRSRK